MEVYKATFNILLRHFGDIPLSELTTAKIEDYLHTRLKKSIFVARHDLANLSCALNKAVRDGYLLSNPCKGIRRFKLPEKLPLFYSKEDFEKLLNAIEDQDIKDIALVAINTGLRQGELITLEWRQINLDERFLILDNRNHITKGKRVHTIPLNKTAYGVIQKRYENRSAKFENVFSIRGEIINQNHFSKEFKKYIIAAGINIKYNFHSLRHSFASYLVQKGVSIYTVSKLLTHADIKTTQIYSHLRREDLRSATDLLD